MSTVLKQDTNGVKPLLEVGELGYDNYPAGGDAGRLYVGTGSANIAIAKKQELYSHVTDTSNPHGVTKAQIGLGNVDDTSDADKRVGSFVIHDTRNVVSVPNNVDAGSGLFEFKERTSVGNPPKASSETYAHVLTTNGWDAGGTGGWPTQVSLGDALSFRKGSGETTWGPWRELISTDTTLGETGQSSLYPMSQKAVTDALAAITSVTTTPVVVATDTTVTLTYGRAVYAVNTSSAARTLTLPDSPTAGATVTIIDYANTCGINKLTIARNGRNIEGAAANSALTQNGQRVEMVYIDAAQGWKIISSYMHGGFI